MGYWLLKTEPSTYSFADLMRDKQAVWDGVSNNLALKNIRAMKKGDLAFMYHSGDEKAIVGVAEITSDPYADPTHPGHNLVVVDLKPRNPLDTRITLAAMKHNKEFASFDLVRHPRLSVMPVPAEMWQTLIALGR
jgi:predicted RNA-binding protein with PUA-like domain